MTTGHVFIGASLDGFIAREDGDIGWLLSRNEPGENYGYDEFMANIDAIVMGRGSFEAVRDSDPWFYERPVLVLSSTLAGQPVPPRLAGRVRFFGGSPKEAMALLEAEGVRRAYVDGGLVVQSFLREGLIADMIVTYAPVLIGRGRPLFGPIPADLPLVHEGTRTYPVGMVQSRYRLAT